MNQVVDVFLMALGSLSFGAMVWIVAHFTLSKWWTRRWLLNRLFGASHQSHTQVPHNLGSVADMLDAIAREVHSGYSLTLAFVNTAERFPNLAWWTEPIAVHCIRGHSLANAIADTTPTNWTADVALATRTLSVASSNSGGRPGGLIRVGSSGACSACSFQAVPRRVGWLRWAGAGFSADSIGLAAIGVNAI